LGSLIAAEALEAKGISAGNNIHTIKPLTRKILKSLKQNVLLPLKNITFWRSWRKYFKSIGLASSSSTRVCSC
jgi:hypothetical protein